VAEVTAPLALTAADFAALEIVGGPVRYSERTRSPNTSARRWRNGRKT
jgi:hypothetical protein